VRAARRHPATAAQQGGKALDAAADRGLPVGYGDAMTRAATWARRAQRSTSAHACMACRHSRTGGGADKFGRDNAVGGKTTVVAAGFGVVEGKNATVFTTQTAVEGKNTMVFAAQTAVEGKNTMVFAVQTAVEGKNTMVVAAQTAVEGKNTMVFAVQTAVEGKNAMVFAVQTAVEGKNTPVVAVQTAVEGTNTTVVAAQTAVEGKNAMVFTAQTAVEEPKTTLILLCSGVIFLQSALFVSPTRVPARPVGTRIVPSAVRNPKRAVQRSNAGARRIETGPDGAQTARLARCAPQRIRENPVGGYRTGGCRRPATAFAPASDVVPRPLHDASPNPEPQLRFVGSNDTKITCLCEGLRNMASCSREPFNKLRG
jgi:hypothetical protein